MKRIIIILSIILFSISLLIVCLFGNKTSFKLAEEGLQNIEVKYDKKYIDCKYVLKGDTVIFNIKSKRAGKTKIDYEIGYKNPENEIKKEKHYKTIYIHSLGIITLNSFLGPCRGDIAFIISFYIIVTLLIIYLIREYINNKKKKLYSYKNARLLGLIIFVILTYIQHIFFFVYDYINNDTYNSINTLIHSLNGDTYLFAMVIFPIFFIVSFLVTISNLLLIKKEGRTWRNLLGFLLGTFICFFTLFAIFGGSTFINPSRSVITYLFNIMVTYIVYLECILFGIIILGIKSAKHVPRFDKDAIIILGCQIKKDGTLTNLLKGRVDRAIEFSKMQKENTDKDIYFVPSGGKGSDEIMSEADSMKNYLLTQGIKKESIIVENKSTNTDENIEFSLKLIKQKIKKPNIAFSTTNYHVYRAGIIASRKYNNVEGIGSKTKTYYWVNAFIREFIATLVSEKKSHIKTLIVLALIILITMVLVSL